MKVKVVNHRRQIIITILRRMGLEIMDISFMGLLIFLSYLIIA